MDAMESAAAVARIDRKSSIESEPRTLGVDQIQFARVKFRLFLYRSNVVVWFSDGWMVVFQEAAEYVVNTRSTDEALTIFTAGLKPVTCAGMAANADTVMDPNEEYFGHGESKLQWPEHRNALSAPF
ncbi:hypothetical protein ACJRO7_033902 [Eucalyptus globulus]|uniref:Uncharacterized protein n=1 Tax=Eucalyptus globulus TaxID=34317 RepID=A0ABD3J4S9_EUCGL